MEFKKLEEVNKRLKTTDIKGKNYVEVNQRILAFKELYENGAITTDILNMDNGVITMKATILDNGVIIATGHAQEKENSTYINKTSYIENCETSAVGRALGMLGIGATESIASAEEVINAINNQSATTTTTTATAGNILEVKLKSGKHVGKKWIEVCKEDMGYIDFLISKDNDLGKKVKAEYTKRFPAKEKTITDSEFDNIFDGNNDFLSPELGDR